MVLSGLPLASLLAVEGAHRGAAAPAAAPRGPARGHDVVAVPLRGRWGRRLGWSRRGRRARARRGRAPLAPGRGCCARREVAVLRGWRHGRALRRRWPRFDQDKDTQGSLGRVAEGSADARGEGQARARCVRERRVFFLTENSSPVPSRKKGSLFLQHMNLEKEKVMDFVA